MIRISRKNNISASKNLLIGGENIKINVNAFLEIMPPSLFLPHVYEINLNNALFKAIILGLSKNQNIFF